MPDPNQPAWKQQRDLKQEMKEQRRRDAARGERTKNIITWTVIGLALAGVVTLIIIGGRGTSPTNASLPAVTASDHIRGKQDAPVVVIEYSDFQCPACAAYFPIMNSLEQKYGEKLAIVYRYFPLQQHKYADLASRAGEAAGLQGKFWEMHDLLFDRQETWSTASNVQQTLIGYATELKLDTAKFTADLDAPTVKDRIAQDVSSGNQIGINGTPTFYLNGQKINTPGNEANFAKLIDEALVKK